MTRRDFLAGTALARLAPAQPQSELAVEGYIFMQYAQRLKKPLDAVLPEVLAMPRAAGFTNLELNDGFFPQSGRERTLAIVRAQNLRMPSLYVGGAMHEKDLADRAMAKALELGERSAGLSAARPSSTIRTRSRTIRPKRGQNSQRKRSR